MATRCSPGGLSLRIDPVDMHPALSAICPTCNTSIRDEDRACGRCGADVTVWPGVGRTPLILPGNPALSADEVRKRISPARILGGTAAGVAGLFFALYLTSASEPAEPPLLFSRGTTGAAVADPPPVALEAMRPPEPATMQATPAAAAPANVAPDRPTLKPLPASIAQGEAEAVVVPARPTGVPGAGAETAPPRTSTPRTAPPRAALADAPAPRAIVASARNAVLPTNAAPALRLSPLVSDSLRPGELLQLRWTVQDLATGRAVQADMEFTSSDASVATVDRRTGTVTARKPGRVRIIADAGLAGVSSLALVVRTPPTVVVALASPAETVQSRTEAARSASVLAAAPALPRTPQPSPLPTPPPVSVVAPPAAATLAPTPTPDSRRDQLPNDGEVRTAVGRIVNDVRGGARNAQVMEFLADGDGHRVALIGTPSTSSSGNNSVRVSFELRLNKFDGGGRPVARIVPVSLTIDKRDTVVTSSAVTIGALRKP